MKSISKIIFVCLIVFVSISITNQTGASQDSGIYTYAFHLYFDNGKLVADRDFTTAFDIIAEQFQQPEVSGTVYAGQILSIKGTKLADFKFDLGNIPSSGKGKLTILAPYFFDAKTANFYDPSGQKVLSLDLAPYGPVCNDDGICNSDSGENYQNCPNDCRSIFSPSPSIPASPSPTPTSGLGSAIKIAIFVLAGVCLVIAAWFLIKSRKSKAGANSQPPPNPNA